MLDDANKPELFTVMNMLTTAGLKVTNIMNTLIVNDDPKSKENYEKLEGINHFIIESAFQCADLIKKDGAKEAREYVQNKLKTKGIVNAN